MNKKLLAVLALSATLIVGCSSVAKTDTIKEGAVDGLGNITESVSVKKGVIGSDNTFAHSQTYVQYGKTDDGAYAIRFATAVKGDIDSLSYTRAAIEGKEAATFQVTTVYRGIEAGEAVYYYDGTDLTTDESHAGNYYWACYTIAFESKAHFASNINVTFNANDAAVSQKQSSLAEICDDCEVVGHNWVREGKLHATSVTKGSINKVCGACGHQEITEVDYNADNSGVLASSGVDAEVNNLDLVRGLKGDFTLKFTYNNKRVSGGNWSQARVCLLNLDEGKWAPGKNDNTNVYGKGVAAPDADAGTHNGAYYVGRSKNTPNCWFPGTFTDHSSDMDVDVTVTRRGDYTFIDMNGKSNLDSSTNTNYWYFYIPAEKTMNVVLGTTFADVTLKSASLTLDNNPEVAKSTQTLVTEDNPVVFAGGKSEQQLIQKVELTGERARATFKFHNYKQDEVNLSWGSWRASLWRTDKKDAQGNELAPHPAFNTNNGNGALLSRILPTHADEWNDWNDNTPVQTGIDWFKSDVSSSYRFEELMMDADVTMIVEKFGRNIFLRAVYETNVKDNAVATKHFTCIIPAETADRVAFSLDGEQSKITLTSCVVENF